MYLKLRYIYFQPLRNEYFDHMTCIVQSQSLRDPLWSHLFLTCGSWVKVQYKLKLESVVLKFYISPYFGL